MSDSRAFPILLAVTALAVLGAVVTLADDPGMAGAPEGLGSPLLPGLADAVNDVARVELRGHELELDLVRDGDRWVLATWEDYPAKGGEVKQLVLQLAEAERLQARTALPERHHLLGVELPPEPDSQALRVRLLDEAGELLADVVLGRTERGPPRSQRVNARRAEREQTWLVDALERPPTAPGQWVERRLLARPVEDMARVSFTGPDGATLRLERAPVDTVGEAGAPDTATEADDGAAPADDAAPPEDDVVPDPAAAPWRLADAPADRAPKPEAVLARAADALAGLRMERVATGPPPADEAVDARWSARFTTHDGLVVEARVARTGEEHQLELAFATEEGSAAATSGEAQELQRTVGAWRYVITPSTANALRRGADDLLEPPPEPEPEGPPAPADPPAPDDVPAPADDAPPADDPDDDG